MKIALAQKKELKILLVRGLLPFCVFHLWENEKYCVYRLQAASLMETPNHRSCGISPLSIPIYPGIQKAWAGMENPTSV